MPKVRVDTTEIDKLTNKIERVGRMMSGGISPTFKRALDRVGDKILEAVKKETPVSDDTRPDYHDTSQFHSGKEHLRDSWKWKLRIQGTLIEGYAYVTTGKLDDLIDLLEAGSPRHPIEAKPGSVLRFYVRKGGGWELAYAKFVADHPGFQSNKFTERAQHKADEIVKELIPVMQEEINTIILGK